MKKKTTTRSTPRPVPAPAGNDLYQAVAEILRTARATAYRAVNFAMVEAYWDIGRKIVEEEQQGRERAEYGAALIKNLSLRLIAEFGRGFTESNLWNFRQFYLAFSGYGAPARKARRTASRIDLDPLSAAHAGGKSHGPNLLHAGGGRAELEHPHSATADHRLILRTPPAESRPDAGHR